MENISDFLDFLSLLLCFVGLEPLIGLTNLNLSLFPGISLNALENRSSASKSGSETLTDRDEELQEEEFSLSLLSDESEPFAPQLDLDLLAIIFIFFAASIFAF